MATPVTLLLFGSTFVPVLPTAADKLPPSTASLAAMGYIAVAGVIAASGLWLGIKGLRRLQSQAHPFITE
ncbi:MAG: hypothetical protein Q4F49_01170 [Pseudoxanthomonas suwonensis]|nr:hypothetical protein [Pseudoxanthomonas suwonensis]